jgi:hypothetical protein
VPQKIIVRLQRERPMTVRHSIRKLNPYICLLLLAVPVGIAEPLKIAGLVGLEKGHWLGGVAILTGGYLLSLLLVTRIFRIVQPRLLALPWFASTRMSILEYRSSFFSRWRGALTAMMVATNHKGVNQVARYVAIFIAAIVILDGTPALASDNNCQRLEELAKEYAGVKLSIDQQALKRRLVVWYESSCRERHAASTR